MTLAVYIFQMENEQPPIHQYMLTTRQDCETRSSSGYLEPNHNHFLFFDDGSNDVEKLLLKRQEIEHELSISKALRSPVAGYQPKSTSMYWRY